MLKSEIFLRIYLTRSSLSGAVSWVEGDS